MIRGVHAMFYTSQPEATRAYLRDKLGLTATDVGDGWLIFDLSGGEVGCHPSGTSPHDRSGTHNISFYCDNIEQTVDELRGRGVEFLGAIEDRGYGLVACFKMPGDIHVELYQPRYSTPAQKTWFA